MKNFLFLIIVSFSLSSCKDELLMNPLPIGCLKDLSLVEENTSCDFDGPVGNCEVSTFATKQLSTTLKTKFVDFCHEINDEIIFSNIDGDTSLARITNKKYQTKSSILVSGNFLVFNPDSCTSNCLAREEAFIDFAASTFTLRIELSSRIESDLFNESNPDQSIRTSFKLGTAVQRQFIPFKEIFSIDLEDHLNRPIFPDTSYSRYYENIVLNNTNYSGIFSNENYINTSIINNTTPPREKIYFHPEDGLVAVRDSLGELWVRR